MLVVPFSARSCCVVRFLVAFAAWSCCSLGPSRRPWETNPEKIPRGPDVVGQAELAAAHDPTFESVARHFPMLAAPREALGVLESAREFVVTRYGEIELNNHQMDKPGQPENYPMLARENTAALYFLFGKKTPKTRYGQGNPPDSKRLVDGYLPMVVVPFTFQGVEYSQTLFAWSRGMDPDGRLWAYVGLKMKNPTAAAVHVDLSHQAVWKAAATVSWATGSSIWLPGRAASVPASARRNRRRSRITGFAAFKRLEAELPFCGDFRAWRQLSRPTSIVASRRRPRPGAAASRGMTIRARARISGAYRAWLAYLFTNGTRRRPLLRTADRGSRDGLGIAAIRAAGPSICTGIPRKPRNIWIPSARWFVPTGS